MKQAVLFWITMASAAIVLAVALYHRNAPESFAALFIMVLMVLCWPSAGPPKQ